MPCRQIRHNVSVYLAADYEVLEADEGKLNIEYYLRTVLDGTRGA